MKYSRVCTIAWCTTTKRLPLLFYDWRYTSVDFFCDADLLHFHLVFRLPPRQLTYSRAINKGGVPDSWEIGIVGAVLPSGNTSPSCVKKQDVSNLFKNLHTRQNEIASRFGGKKSDRFAQIERAPSFTECIRKKFSAVLKAIWNRKFFIIDSKLLLRFWNNTVLRKRSDCFYYTVFLFHFDTV